MLSVDCRCSAGNNDSCLICNPSAPLLVSSSRSVDPRLATATWTLLDQLHAPWTMTNMNRRVITALAAAGLLLSACSGGNDNNATEGDASGEGTETTVVDERVTPPTLPAGQAVELGSIESVIQELDQACADAVQPIRDLQKSYQSALELTDEDLPKLNGALSEGFANCSSEEWNRYQQLELQGWLNAVPSDEAIAEAQRQVEERAAESTTTTAD